MKPKMFRMIARITTEDNDSFQEGYGIVSEWAKRHDKSDGTLTSSRQQSIKCRMNWIGQGPGLIGLSLIRVSYFALKTRTWVYEGRVCGDDDLDPLG